MQSIPVNLNIVVLRKCTKTYELKFTKSNAPIDITGWTIVFMAKEDLTDEDSEAVITHIYHTADMIDPVNGRMLIKLTATDTDVHSDNLYYAVKFITNSDPVDEGVIYHGRLTIQNTVIRGM
jgi:hypothetical protein